MFHIIRDIFKKVENNKSFPRLNLKVSLAINKSRDTKVY